MSTGQPSRSGASLPARPWPEPPARRPYQKPDFRHERAFETTALGCGKIQDTQLQCRQVRKAS